MENQNSLIEKHLRIAKDDLKKLDEIKKSKYKVNSYGDVIHFLLKKYEKSQQTEAEFKKLKKEKSQMNAQNKQLSRIEIALDELLFVKGIGKKTFRGYDAYKEPLDQAVDRIIKISQERLATNSVRERKVDNVFDYLFH